MRGATTGGTRTGGIRKLGCGCLAVLLLPTFFLVWQIAGNDYTYSEGTRVGMINKFSHKGLLFKTWEGEMALQGIVSGERGLGANIWTFSLDSQSRHRENIQELEGLIQKHLEAGAKVRIKYIQQLASWPWRGSTRYFVQSVEAVDGGGAGR